MRDTDLARIRSAVASPHQRPHDSDVLALLGCYEEARAVLRAVVAMGPSTGIRVQDALRGGLHDPCRYCREPSHGPHRPDCLWPRIVAAAGDREPEGVSVG